MGLANNPVVNTIAKGVKSVTDRFADDENSDQAKWDELIDEYVAWEIDPRSAGTDKDMSTYELAYKNMGADKRAEMLERAKFLVNKDPFFHGNDGLDERYTFSDNPRGDTEIIGTAKNIPGLLSTGTVLGPDVQLVPPKATPPPFNPNVIVNLNDQTPTLANEPDSLLSGVTQGVIDALLTKKDKKQDVDSSTPNQEAADIEGAKDVVDTNVSNDVVVGSDNTVVPTPTTTLPTTGGDPVTVPEEPNPIRNPRSSDPVLWTDLEWRQNNLGYKGKGDRARAYDKNMGMLKQAMAAQALGVDFKLPKGLTDKELYEAGKLT